MLENQASLLTDVRDLLEAVESYFAGLTVLDLVLLLLAGVGIWWVVANARAAVRIGPVEIEPLESDDDQLEVKGYSAMLRERLARSGLSPPPEVPAGAPRTELINAIEASPAQQATWLARLLEVLPSPPRPASYRLSGTLMRAGDEYALSYWLRPTARYGAECLDTARGGTYEEAVARAATSVFMEIVNNAQRAYPSWSRWRDVRAFERYREGLEARDALTRAADCEPVIAVFEQAARREPRNLLPRLQMANLLERQASIASSRDAASCRARALEHYLEIVEREPSILQAHYRASLLLGMLSVDWKELTDERRQVLTALLELENPPAPAAFTAVPPPPSVETFRTALAERARLQSWHAWLRSFGMWTLFVDLRPRHELEIRGHERRLLKRTLALSRLCLRAKSFPGPPAEHRIRAWCLSTWVDVRHMLGGGLTAGWQAHYNAACFYALLYGKEGAQNATSPRRRKAFNHLRRALAEPDADQLSPEWLRTGDPDLESLRGAGAEWQECVARHVTAPHASVHVSNTNGAPVRSARQWRALAGPVSAARWEPERSGDELARWWLDGGPDVLRQTLSRAPALRNLEIERAIAGLRTSIDGAGRARWIHDLLLVGEAVGGRTVVSIKAARDEPFGTTVGDLPEQVSMSSLIDALTRRDGTGAGPPPPVTELRVELLLALAATLAAAADEDARQAVLVVRLFERRISGLMQPTANAADVATLVQAVSDRPCPVGAQWWAGPAQVPGNARLPADVPVYVAKIATRPDGLARSRPTVITA